MRLDRVYKNSQSPAIPGSAQSQLKDLSENSRLAYWRLRNAGMQVPKKILLGVIVEIPLAAGLDTIAAYSEGGVRYINQTGKMAVFEGVTSLQPLVDDLFQSSQMIVEHIGPWDRASMNYAF
jgi:hypothetical protein